MQVTNALIVQEIDRFSDNDLEALYELIQTFGQTHQQNKKASLMSQLRQIQIDGPEDFGSLGIPGVKCLYKNKYLRPFCRTAIRRI